MGSPSSFPSDGLTRAALVTATVRMARGAGAVLQQAMTASFAVSHKSAIDLVTTADHASEAFILNAIRTQFSDHSIIAEESGSLAGTAGSDAAPYRWIVDPLDGTVNFAHRIPQWCVLIGVQQRQSDGSFCTVVGVTFDPIRNELFVASRGEGATLNGQPIHVSTTHRLIDSIGCTGFGYQRLQKAHQDNHAEFCRLNLVTQGVRRLGSAGLDLAYLAAGRLDYFWEYDLHLWDLVPGALLLEEAGGRITHLDPHALPNDGVMVPFSASEATLPAHTLCHVLASNGVLHTSLRDVLYSAQHHPVNDRSDLAAYLPPELARLLPQ